MVVMQLGNLNEDGEDFKNRTTGRVYDVCGVCPTLNTMQGGNRQPLIIDDTQGFENRPRIYEQVSPCLRSERNGLKVLVESEDDSKSDSMGSKAVRKITPRESWRLMDFSDEDFDKAQKINSDSQLYKQAGNSIVENLLIAIVGQMIPGKENVYKDRK